MVAPTLTLQMDTGAGILDAEDNSILDANDNAILDADWSTANADIRDTSIHIRKGNFGLSQLDRVADVGTMSFELDNSASNETETLGYYSPSHDDACPSFNEATKTRLLMASAGNSIYKFQGVRLDVIDPNAGIYGRRATAVTAVDWMDEAVTSPARGLDIQLAKRDDQLLTTLLAVMENQPEATDFDVGPDQYGAAFHDVRSETTVVVGVMQSIVLSGIGTIYLNGTASTGESLTYRNRSTLLSTLPVVAIRESMIDISAPRVSRNRVRKVIATTYPLRIDPSATTELFVLGQEITIAAGATKTFTGRYIDPSLESVRIAGTSIVTPLVANTHFKFSSVSGSGTDLNGDLGISLSAKGDATEFEFTNNAAVEGFLWFLKIIGKGVYLYEQIDHIAEDTTIRKGQVLSYDMIYQDSYGVGKNAAASLLDWETDQTNERPIIHFKANSSSALMAAAILVEPGVMVSIEEALTGVNRDFFVNGIEMDIKKGGLDIDVYWHCAPAQEAQAYCILNLVGFAELNTTAILAF